MHSLLDELFNPRWRYYTAGSFDTETATPVRYNDGTVIYFKQGIVHREDGPAIKGPNREEYYLHGVKYSKEDFIAELDKTPITVTLENKTYMVTRKELNDIHAKLDKYTNSKKAG